MCHFRVDEQANVLPDATLFIDHAKPHAGKAHIKISQHLLQGIASSQHARSIPGIRT